MHNNESKQLGLTGSQLRELRDSSRKRKLMRQLALYSFALSFLLLLMLVTGCASQPVVQCEPPPPIPPYVLTQPLPSESYLTTAQKRMESWQKRLSATPSTSKP